jgi:hypothetical protein
MPNLALIETKWISVQRECLCHFKDTIPENLKQIFPEKGWPQFQFPHSSVCERFIYSHDRSAYSAAGLYVDRSSEYINCSQTHERRRNWDWGRAIPFLGIHKWDFCRSVAGGGGVLEPSKRTEKTLAPTIKSSIKLSLLSFLILSILFSSLSDTPSLLHWPTSPSSCYSIWLNYSWRSLASSLTICQ